MAGIALELRDLRTSVEGADFYGPKRLPLVEAIERAEKELNSAISKTHGKQAPQ